MTASLAQPGKQVRFQIRHVHIPDPTGILREIYGGNKLVGTVIDVSDGGTGQLFAVIEVDTLQQTVVVAADHLEPA